jgi:hypothetical protein
MDNRVTVLPVCRREQCGNATIAGEEKIQYDHMKATRRGCAILHLLHFPRYCKTASAFTLPWERKTKHMTRLALAVTRLRCFLPARNNNTKSWAVYVSWRAMMTSGSAFHFAIARSNACRGGSFYALNFTTIQEVPESTAEQLSVGGLPSSLKL